jgi:hypothetical protein
LWVGADPFHALDVRHLEDLGYVLLHLIGPAVALHRVILASQINVGEASLARNWIDLCAGYVRLKQAGCVAFAMLESANNIPFRLRIPVWIGDNDGLVVLAEDVSEHLFSTR